LVSNAFRLLGSGELQQLAKERGLSMTEVSNAFRLLGSGEREISVEWRPAKNAVSNAFRLLGSGEPLLLKWRPCVVFPVSNAFRLLGSGEQDQQKMKNRWEQKGLKCLSAFGFWGTQCVTNKPK